MNLLGVVFLAVLDIVLISVQGGTLDGKDVNKFSTVNKHDDHLKTADRPFEWLLRSKVWNSSNPDSIIPRETITACGGHVEVNEELTNIFYEPTGGYVPNQRCVWYLHHHYSTTHIYTDQMSHDTGNNGLIINYFPSNATQSMNVERIPNENQAHFSYPNYNGHSVLMFSSSENGRGSKIRFAVSRGGTTNSNRSHRTANPITAVTGTINLTMSHTTQSQETWVFQPPNGVHTTIAIKYLRMTNGTNFLKIFTLIPYHYSGAHIEALSYTDYHPFGPPNSETESTEPRLYMVVFPSTVGPNERATLEWTSP